MRKKIFVFFLCLFFLAVFHLELTAEEEINGYVIPIEGQLKNSISVVNLLLEEGIPVYQANQAFVSCGRTYNKGDYIVSIPNDENSFVDDVFRSYALYLAARLGVDIFPFSSSIFTHAYCINESDVAVYFGKGTSAGALWNIEPAEEAKFDVNIVLEEDIIQGKLADFNMIIFGSGGFYSYYLGNEANNRIKEFIEAGNGFHGACGGSVYGVELGLLNVSLDMEGGWPAAADLRGPIVVSNEAPDHPTMFTIGDNWRPNYWIGQNFEQVGNDVTILARYLSPTAELVPYDPAISRAYGYYPNTEIINRFWGRAASVSGFYVDGKVVLTGTHPEYYPETQNFYINTLQYLNSQGPFYLDTQSLPPLDAIQEYDPVGETILHYQTVISAIRKIYHFKELIVAARTPFYGLEEENEEITNATGEFLIDFLDDMIDRSSRLKRDVLKLSSQFLELSALEYIMDILQPQIPQDQYTIGKNRVQFAKSQIVAIITELDGIDALNTPAESIVPKTIRFRQDLEDLLALRETQGETPEFFEGVISLFSAENETLQNVKFDLESCVLKWSFETDKALESAHFAQVLVKNIIHLN